MTNQLRFYGSKQHNIAEKYLRENGFNSITWEYFVGDFNGTIKYLNKIANHIWDTFKIDETEIFSNIFHKSVLNAWDEKYKPSKDVLDVVTHVIFGESDFYGDNEVYPLTIDELILIENNLHHAIVNGLNNK